MSQGLASSVRKPCGVSSESSTVIEGPLSTGRLSLSLFEVSHFHPEGRLKVFCKHKQHTDLYILTPTEMRSIDTQRWKKRNELCRQGHENTRNGVTIRCQHHPKSKAVSTQSFFLSLQLKIIKPGGLQARWKDKMA